MLTLEAVCGNDVYLIYLKASGMYAGAWTLPVALGGPMGEHREHESATVSHAVVATYVADAARSVKEVVALRSSPWRSISPWSRDAGPAGVVVRETDSGLLDVGVHVCLAWGSVIPEVAAKVEQAVREHVRALLDMELGAITLFVDDITDPTEVTSPQEV